MSLEVAKAAEDVFLAYATAEAAAVDGGGAPLYPALAGFSILPGRDYADRPIPCVIFNGADDKPRENGSRGVFDVDLEIVLISESTVDTDSTLHAAAVAAIIGIFNPKGAVRAGLSGGIAVFDYWLKGSPRKIVQGAEWETLIPLTVVCQPSA